MYNIRNARGNLRNDVIQNWFQRFVDGRAYEKTEFHDFCKDIKGKSEAEIKKYYQSLV